MNGFNVCFKFIITWNFFFIFVNLPLRILTPYSAAFFVFSGVAFSKRATISTLVGSANLAAILNFTTHTIWAEILVVKEPIRELRCHYLVTFVYNKYTYATIERRHPDMADILHQISTIDKETFPLVNNMNPGLVEWSKCMYRKSDIGLVVVKKEMWLIDGRVSTRIFLLFPIARFRYLTKHYCTKITSRVSSL